MGLKAMKLLLHIRHQRILFCLPLFGAADLRPALSAINAGKNIALANKETLVMAGELCHEACRIDGREYIPG